MLKGFRSAYRSRFGAQTSAKFRACMFVWVLNVARWAKCLVRYSRVLNTVEKSGCHLDLCDLLENGTVSVMRAAETS